MEKRKIAISWYLVTFAVAFSSMIYQFSIAYAMSVVFGDIVTNYILNAGIFILFLGFGSLFYDFKKNKGLLFFFRMELYLSLAGLVACLFPFFLDLIPGFILAKKVFCLCFSAMVAFLSGMELPWLMDLGSSKINTIGIDYLGMVVAGLCYPFLFLPYLGVIPTSLFTVCLNSLVVICLSLLLKKHRKIIIFFIPQIVMTFFYSRIDKYLQEIFLR